MVFWLVERREMVIVIELESLCLIALALRVYMDWRCDRVWKVLERRLGQYVLTVILMKP